MSDAEKRAEVFSILEGRVRTETSERDVRTIRELAFIEKLSRKEIYDRVRYLNPRTVDSIIDFSSYAVTGVQDVDDGRTNPVVKAWLNHKLCPHGKHEHIMPHPYLGFSACACGSFFYDHARCKIGDDRRVGELTIHDGYILVYKKRNPSWRYCHLTKNDKYVPLHVLAKHRGKDPAIYTWEEELATVYHPVEKPFSAISALKVLYECFSGSHSTHAKFSLKEPDRGLFLGNIEVNMKRLKKRTPTVQHTIKKTKPKQVAEPEEVTLTQEKYDTIAAEFDKDTETVIADVAKKHKVSFRTVLAVQEKHFRDKFLAERDSLIAEGYDVSAADKLYGVEV